LSLPLIIPPPLKTQPAQIERLEWEGDLNRSMQHFILKYLRGGVDNETKNPDLLL